MRLAVVVCAHILPASDRPRKPSNSIPRHSNGKQTFKAHCRSVRRTLLQCPTNSVAAYPAYTGAARAERHAWRRGHQHHHHHHHHHHYHLAMKICSGQGPASRPIPLWTDGDCLSTAAFVMQLGLVRFPRAPRRARCSRQTHRSQPAALKGQIDRLWLGKVHCRSRISSKTNAGAACGRARSLITNGIVKTLAQRHSAAQSGVNNPHEVTVRRLRLESRQARAPERYAMAPLE